MSGANAKSCMCSSAVLCRPVEDSQATKRGQSQPNDGRGKLVGARVAPLSPTDRDQPSDQEVIRAVEAVAKKRGVTMAEVAVAWSLQSQWVTAPIVGVRSTERLDELIKGLSVELSKEDIEQINKPYIPVAIRGHT